MDADANVGSGAAMNEREIGERIALIEAMMRDGRRSTQHWGWNFLLWGAAYFIAVVWSSFLPAGRILAWPVTMVIAVVLTVVIKSRLARHEPRTERSRALQSIWTGVGCGIFVFAFPAAYSGHFEAHAFMAAIEVMLGIAHVASGSFLRWTMQIVVGALWWIAAIASCFASTGNEVAYVFLAATFVCNICFGIYLMVRESQDKARVRTGRVQHV